MAEPSRRDPAVPKKRSSGCGCGGWIALAFLFLIFAGVALGPINGNRHFRAAQGIQTAHTLALAMFAYANDHDGQYPEGTSSTEVFQQLLDGSYVSDPAIFFLKMPGKIKAEPKQRLKPENVCFDVITPVDNRTPDTMPILFSTGYRIDLTPGGAAVPRQMYSGWTESPRPLSPEWDRGNEGIAVACKNNGSRFVRLQPADPTHPQGSIPGFIPEDLDFHGQVYHQLTPEGVLP